MWRTEDHFDLQKSKGRRVERFEKGKKREGILAGQARLCPDGQEGKGPEDEWTGPFSWRREGAKGKRT